MIVEITRDMRAETEPYGWVLKLRHQNEKTGETYWSAHGYYSTLAVTLRAALRLIPAGEPEIVSLEEAVARIDAAEERLSLVAAAVSTELARKRKVVVPRFDDEEGAA